MDASGDVLFGSECYTRFDVGLQALDALINELLLAVVGRGEDVRSLLNTRWLENVSRLHGRDKGEGTHAELARNGEVVNTSRLGNLVTSRDTW